MSRPVASVLMVAAILFGIWLGIGVFAFLTGAVAQPQA